MEERLNRTAHIPPMTHASAAVTSITRLLLRIQAARLARQSLIGISRTRSSNVTGGRQPRRSRTLDASLKNILTSEGRNRWDRSQPDLWESEGELAVNSGNGLSLLLSSKGFRQNVFEELIIPRERCAWMTTSRPSLGLECETGTGSFLPRRPN
jgi:hypothetical protein